MPKKDAYLIGLNKLQKKISYKFKNNELLISALTHSSAKKSKKELDYERLEFLGDAVLDLAVAHLLIETYPKLKEGDLSKMRASLVNTESLAKIAREYEIGSLIKLSKGETQSGGSDKSSILADVVEAIFGAIYLDSNFVKAFKSAKSIFQDRVINVSPKDPKTELQEFLHIKDSLVPLYELISTKGPDHAPTFTSVVKINGEIYGTGFGVSKKTSEQAAANQALLKLKEEKC